MARFSSWWRKRAGALVACLLAVFALLPALDAVICEADESPAAHALADHAVAGQGLTQPDHPGHTESSGLCAHGHFHQTSTEAPSCAAFHTPIRMEARPFALAPSAIPPSDRHFPPIRPPRA